MEKSDNIRPWQVECQRLFCAWRIMRIYEMGVYLLKWKCKSLFLWVCNQWINDALIEKHSFMICGTNCDWTADSALDCGIVMAGLALQEPSFNLDRCGLWINLHTQLMFFFFFSPPFAGSHKHTSVSFCTCLLKCFEMGTAAYPAQMLAVWFLTRNKEDFFSWFFPCWYNSSLSLTTITGQRWVCAKRWCHWIASPLSLLCNQPLCTIQVWLYRPKC